MDEMIEALAVRAAPPEPAIAGWTRALAATAGIEADPQRTLPSLVAARAMTNGDAPALLSDEERLTYRELAARMNRVGRWAQSAGLRPGDVVGLMMESRPDYVALWLGFTRVGVVVALFNTNLSGAALAHCARAAGARDVVVSPACAEAWASAAAHLDPPPRVWVRGEPAFDAALAAQSDAQPQAAPVTIRDRALLIYTSGTTGLPKAAVVTHRRVLAWALWFAGMCDVRADDRMYDCLPLYHSVGGVVAVGAALSRGASVVVAPFSVSRFWDDVRRWRCTLFQYIGELCRYLLTAPPRADDGAHALRLCVGNGLREDVWRRFETRFSIPRIIEFYASSEGTFSLYNMEGEPGAIGRVPGFLAHRFPAAVVRHDAATGLPLRNAQGHCEKASRDEVGEAIGRIAGGENRFEGYTDAAATEAKILRDVFSPGDAWMRTGDLMTIDRRGFWRFVDRVGDTFRWKGENVATLEVAGVLAACPGVTDAVVYGVAVPGAEGRAGMAALTVSADFDRAGFAAHVMGALPAYARPVFLRIMPVFAMTGTFKHRPVDLAKDGFDPAAVADPLFVLDGARYAPLDATRFAAIVEGRTRL